jgi:hypothetical protein
MKSYTTEEGKVFKRGDQLFGAIIYTPDDFDDSLLEQIPEPLEEEEPGL